MFPDPERVDTGCVGGDDFGQELLHAFGLGVGGPGAWVDDFGNKVVDSDFHECCAFR